MVIKSLSALDVQNLPAVVLSTYSGLGEEYL